MSAPFRELVVDLDAVSANVVRLRERAGTPHLMAVVKADAYGHGAVESACAALAGGADWLGVADLSEASQLRAAGIEAPLLAWLHDPDEDFVAAIAAGVDIGVSSLAHLEAAAAAGGGSPAFVQLKLETGLSRNGLPEEQWEAVFARAHELERSGRIVVRGVFSHLSNASPAEDRAAIAAYERGLARAEAAGLAPELRHIAASAAAISLPEARFTLVRLGLAIYGLSPFGAASATELGLRPALTLRARVAAVRRVPAGKGVSYDYTYRTERETTLALVPVGYGDGLPRHASNLGPVSIGGERFRVSGRIAMDQFVVDVGDAPVAVGDEVVLFGDPARGVPGADDWAAAAETINYEIVTRLGGRLRRTFRGGPA
ncbi:alanine racemase [Leifsonia xyli subsp. xyli]|uniref:Alanine racemase n=2 Tax=Leifsonia xyli subsp. xyli TaxID=59736 RepID=Q6AD34_LEIXX|nr:alanine racemase [Leifsonia xyli]AAT89710.1 alanine racemase [Leifsonia xyli subsp. xyli str. CTCB07]ODA91188.1 alanine racemase [Leifsonia xyli subsp. xyli]